MRTQRYILKTYPKKLLSTLRDIFRDLEKTALEAGAADSLVEASRIVRSSGSSIDYR